MLAVALLGAAGLVVLLVLLWVRARGEARGLKSRFGPIIDVEAERLRVEAERAWLQREVDGLGPEIARARAVAKAERDATKAKFESAYKAATAELERLKHEVQALDERAQLQSFGLYTPTYDFGTSESYKVELGKVRAAQAAMLKAATAATCATEWTISGDRRKGKQATDHTIKLMLRAFNGESDASIAKVRFNNVVAIGERIDKAFHDINKLGSIQTCAISETYRKLKAAEVRLTHEHAEKLQAEKEEQRAIRERLRDEEAAQRDFERAQREAEKEEQRESLALSKARAELAVADGARREEMERRVSELEIRLAQAHEQKERAIAQAQLTKSGHVYVISNEGSFGPEVFKVGMTRRLEPLERVRELGDASVPFSFDVHAIIYSDDAPGLENGLHKLLSASRVNRVNHKKEFFETTLDEIEAAVRKSGDHSVEFVRTAVAEEYRKTVVLRAQLAGAGSDGQPAGAPDEAREVFAAISRGLDVD